MRRWIIGFDSGLASSTISIDDALDLPSIIKIMLDYVSKQRNVDPDHIHDITRMLADDYFEETYGCDGSCKNCTCSDGVSVDIDEDVFTVLALEAHKENMTTEEYINMTLGDIVDARESSRY